MHLLTLSREFSCFQLLKTTLYLPKESKKKAYDKKHSCPEVFQVGAFAMKKDFTRKKCKGGKLDPKWVGPYCITSNLGRGLYQLKQLSKPFKTVSHVNGVHLKKFVRPLKVRFNAEYLN